MRKILNKSFFDRNSLLVAEDLLGKYLVRKINGKKQNYLIYNKRENGKWVKKSRFIGTGKIAKEKIGKLKEEFELSLKLEKSYKYLKKDQIKEK